MGRLYQVPQQGCLRPGAGRYPPVKPTVGRLYQVLRTAGLRRPTVETPVQMQSRPADGNADTPPYAPTA